MVRTRFWRVLLWLTTALFSTNLFAAICEFSVVNEWNAGYTSSVSITNDTDQTINGWTASVDFADNTTISHMWNASLSGNDPYQATNMGYNATIPPGGSVSFGFNSQKGTSHTPAQIPQLGGVCGANNTNHQPVAVASATPLQGVIPLTVNFNGGASTDSNGDALTYLWQFEDGTTSSDVTTTHTFTVAGTYTVSLTVNDGAMDSEVTTVTVIANPQSPTTAQCEYIRGEEWNAGFTSTVRITNVDDQAIVGWAVAIDFAGTASISHIWNADVSGSNPYIATNKGYNQTIQPNSTVSFGFNSNKTVTNSAAQAPTLGGICGSVIAVNQPPVANASVTPLQGTAPLTVNFDASGSSDADEDVLSYLWDFGEGSTSNNAINSHTYGSAGTYTASLIVNDGSVDSETVDVTIVVTEPVDPDSYQLDAGVSSLHFVSTKKIHAIETHTFTELSGEISADGAAVVRINLDSVESGIDVRNQRMRDFLFQTAIFSEAEITLDVDMAALSNIAIGGSLNQTITPLVNLHGFSVPIEIAVSITRLSDTKILVRNTAPILVHSDDFGLTSGIEVLRGLAGLSVISYAVPTNFTLIFNTQ